MIGVILGEDNTHGTAGYDAVSSVIMNRVGTTNDADKTRDVLLAPNQFDAKRGDAYEAAMAYPQSGDTHGRFTDAQFREAAATAEGHFTGKTGDTSHGATNFFRDRIPNTSWGQKAIKAAKMERKYPEGYKSDQKHNNVFWGPVAQP